LRELSIQTVRITKIDQKSVRVVTDSGVPGIIMKSDLKDKTGETQVINDGEIGKHYYIGEYLRAKVKSIDYAKVRLKLSTNQNDLVNHREFLRKNNILEKYRLQDNTTFKVDQKSDFLSVLTNDRKKNNSRYTPRRINHPRFKNMSLQNAKEYLNDREIGDFVIRPSSKGTDHLNITWKLSNDKVVHLDIKEGIKGPNDMISKHLTLDRDIYESLDEIIERYIKPCNALVVQIREHKKFMDEEIEYVKQTLIDEKKNEPTLIPYYISFSNQTPQCLVLSYIPKHYDSKHEYIKIKPDGLLFHELKFNSIKKLVAWFKSKLKTSEYQKYVKSVVIPNEGQFGGAMDKRRVKAEGDVKQEHGTNPRYGNRGGFKKEKDTPNKKYGQERRGEDRRVQGKNSVKRRNKDSDEENKGFMKPNKKKPEGMGMYGDANEWEANDLENNRNWDDVDFNKASQAKSKVKREGSRSRSRSNEKNKALGEAKGKRSAISKQSFNSEFLHNAWGNNTGGANVETWNNEAESNDWTKSEIKTENDWGHSTKNEENTSLYQNKELESNSNWG